MNSFKQFLIEKELFLNLDENPGEMNVGVLDSDSADFEDQVRKIKNELITPSLAAYVENLLKIKNFKLTNKASLLDLVKKYYNGSVEDIAKLSEHFYNLKLEEEQNILQEIANHFKEFFPQQFFEKVALLTFSDIPHIGRGELLLGLFTNLEKSLDKGDLVNPKTKDTIELKGKHGMLAGVAKTKAAKAALSELRDVFLRNDVAITFTPDYRISNGTIDVILEAIHENGIKLTDEFITKIIDAIRQYSIRSSSEHISILRKLIEKRDKMKIKEFFIALHMEGYVVKEKVDYIIFFTNASYDNAVIFKTKDSTFRDVLEFVAKNVKASLQWSSAGIERAFSLIS